MNITIIIGITVLTCLALVAMEAVHRPVEKAGISWVQFGRAYKTIGLFGMAMPVYVVVSSLVMGRPWQAVILGSMFFLIGAPVFSLAFYWKVGYDVEGIYCRSPWRRRRFIPWSQVKRIRFSSLWKHWVVETQCCGNVTIPELAIGARSAIEQWKGKDAGAVITRTDER